MNGVVRALSTTRDRLIGLGHDVEVIAPERFKNVPCPTYPEIRLALCTPAKVGSLIADYAPDAVHIATEGPLGWSARWWLKRRAIPFTTSFHTMFPKYLKLRFGLPESWSFAAIRRFHAAAGATMYSTPRLRDLLHSNGFRNLTGWVRGVDTELFTPGAAEPLDFPGPIQMYVGRIAIEKSIEDFLRTDSPGTKVIVGDGPQREQLERKYPAAKFLGPKYGDELVAHYRAADVFVFPSRTDTLGLVMLEAMACGIPVAAFPVQGPLDVVADSGAGVLNENLAIAIEQAQLIRPDVCRARALEHSWDESVLEFHANLIHIPTPAYHFRAEGGTA
ncbi:MAG: glycosyltransferase family 1 protein [Gammaproteobacteria bacterium]|nr:glycosyltransferase family 1 protein [Gammaproteobacteria bacterium]